MRSTLRKVVFLVFFTIMLQGFALADEQVTIGTNQLRISLPVFVAQEKGFFKKNHLNVKLEIFDTAQPLVDALCGGRLDVAGYSALPITFNAQLRSKRELVYTTALLEDNEHPVSLFIAPKDSSIKSIADLKGKNIGILPTFAYKVWLELILKKNGIQPSEVTIVPVAPAMTPSALESKTIDVAFTNDPAVTTCLRKGIARLLFTEALVPKYIWSPFPFASFNMSKEFVQKHPEAARNILKSLNEAIDFIAANQQEAKRSMAKFIPESQRPFVEYYPNALFVKSSGFSAQTLMKIEEDYRAKGIIKERLDLTTSVYW